MNATAGSGLLPVEVFQPVTGLTPCTTYHCRIFASNSAGGAYGDDATFETNCKPSATTLPVAPISATTGDFNGSVNPNGQATTYFYNYGTTTAYGSVTPIRSVGNRNTAIQPLTEPVSGLTPQTTYHVQILATNSLGTTAGSDVTFTPPPQSGRGPVGPQGPVGMTGAQGVTGTPGAGSTNGTNGTNGVQDIPGIPGAPGAKGAPGLNTAASKAPTTVIIQSGSSKALVKISTTNVLAGTKGRRKGQIRLQIFCKRITGQDCAGTVSCGRSTRSTRRRAAGTSGRPG